MRKPRVSRTAGGLRACGACGTRGAKTSRELWAGGGSLEREEPAARLASRGVRGACERRSRGVCPPNVNLHSDRVWCHGPHLPRVRGRRWVSVRIRTECEGAARICPECGVEACTRPECMLRVPAFGPSAVLWSAFAPSVGGWTHLDQMWAFGTPSSRIRSKCGPAGRENHAFGPNASRAKAGARGHFYSLLARGGASNMARAPG